MDYQGIKGLHYIDNYLTEEELIALDTLIDNITLVPITNARNSRRTAHFGYEYSYFSSALKDAPKIPAMIGNIMAPARINAVANLNLTQSFDQCIINEYKPGQQIAAHIDHTRNFGPVVACITIGVTSPITFTRANEVITISPINGSLYIMIGESRYEYKHSLVNRSNDTRYSFTFRTVNK